MSVEKKRIAILLALPHDRPRDTGFCLLRKVLKTLLRSYGIVLVDIREQETLTIPELSSEFKEGAK